MQWFKTLWARFMTRCYEARARREKRRRELTPDEIIATLRKGQAIINDAARRAGVL